MTEATIRAPQAYRSLTDFAPQWIVAPGETIADMIEERGWTRADFARRAGFSEKHVNMLLKGKGAISSDTAMRLETVLGSTAGFWLRLEAQYQAQLLQQNTKDVFGSDAAWLKEIPLRHMLTQGWVRKHVDKAAQVLECLRFFEVSNVKSWRNSYAAHSAAFRAPAKFRRDPAAVSAWLRQCERESEKLATRPYEQERFEAALHSARQLSLEADVAVFFPKLQAVCAQAGVSVVVVPPPMGCPVSGAAKWLGGGRGMIALSLRGKTDDKLWFTFFHEAAHLLMHGKSLTFVDAAVKDGLESQHELEADAFARDHLIPQADFAAFVAKHPNPNKTDVIRFAKQLGVSLGIVVGRLQHEKVIPFSVLNGLKMSYVFTKP
jgi:HTH-type transcriptional regulator / antitoxin HigA